MKAIDSGREAQVERCPAQSPKRDETDNPFEKSRHRIGQVERMHKLQGFSRHSLLEEAKRSGG